MKKRLELTAVGSSELGANLRGSEIAISWHGKGPGERRHRTPGSWRKAAQHIQVRDAEVRLASQTLQPFIFCAKMTDDNQFKKKDSISVKIQI